MMAGWEPPVVDDDPMSGPIDRDAEGVDMDWEGVQLRDEVAEEGNQLGQVIDVDNDGDNGGVPLDVPAPGASVLAPVPTEEVVTDE